MRLLTRRFGPITVAIAAYCSSNLAQAGLLITSSVSMPPNSIVDTFVAFNKPFTAYADTPVEVGVSGQSIFMDGEHDERRHRQSDPQLQPRDKWQLDECPARVHGTKHLVGFHDLHLQHTTRVGRRRIHQLQSERRRWDIIIAALDNTGAVIESYDITTLAPISVTGSNNGGFRGIVDTTADIYAVSSLEWLRGPRQLDLLDGAGAGFRPALRDRIPGLVVRRGGLPASLGLPSLSLLETTRSVVCGFETSTRPPLGSVFVNGPNPSDGTISQNEPKFG